jgi:hypothetical protein
VCGVELVLLRLHMDVYSSSTSTLRHPVEIFLTDFSSILASASIGTIHMFR